MGKHKHSHKHKHGHKHGHNHRHRHRCDRNYRDGAVVVIDDCHDQYGRQIYRRPFRDCPEREIIRENIRYPCRPEREIIREDIRYPCRPEREIIREDIRYDY